MATKAELRAIAREYGCASLISVNSDSKTVKGQKKGYLTGVMYMMPDDILCPVSKLAGCREACLVSAGRAAFTPGIGMARAARTRFFHADRENFMALLVKEIASVVKKAEKNGQTPAIRLNGTSDVNWANVTFEGKSVFEHFPNVQFYDYTKSPSIISTAAAGVTNWHVTGSYSEASAKYAAMITNAASKYGANLSVVFRKELPETFMGLPVISGDETDLRFLDDRKVIVGLKAKGPAKKDSTGFVVDPEMKAGSNIIAAA